MYYATSVHIEGGRFRSVSESAVADATIEGCLVRLGTRVGELAAFWEFPGTDTPSGAQTRILTTRPDIVVTRHSSAFVLNLHEEHLNDFILRGRTTTAGQEEGTRA